MRVGLCHYAMFVRFRQQGRRLQARLMQTGRVAGKMQSVHLAALGSVDAEVSVRERLAFWASLPARLDRLGNRVGAEDHAKIYGALHARIPMVTPDEQRAVQEENAEDDSRFWEAMRDLAASEVQGNKGLIAHAEAKIAQSAPRAAEAAEGADLAKERIKRLRRGEAVAGGLGKRLDIDAAIKAGGFAPSAMKRMVLMASLTTAEFESLPIRNGIEASDRALERAARRIVRARRREAEKGALTEGIKK
jgi:hypothetical protein